MLVHVCRRWRNLVLESPRRLNLQLYCTPETPAKDTLDIWPALPLVVLGHISSSGTDNIITALGQHNRVCTVILWDIAGSKFEEILATMQVPFPELTQLLLSSNGKTVPTISDSFLDGSAPHLQIFSLDSIQYPGMINLLSSANHLVELCLSSIPHSWYISPEAIVALISVMPSLDLLAILFQSPQSRPGQATRRPLPSRRSVIPALTHLRFNGVSEYLEDLVTGIDTPQLGRMDITLFNQIDFDIPQLGQFIKRTSKVTKRDAFVQFYDKFAQVQLPSQSGPRTLEVAISCREPDWQLSSIEQVCKSSFHALSTIEDLYIEHRYLKLVWKDDAIDNTLWLQLRLPFTTVKNLYLSKECAPGIAAALEELAGGATLLLPGLQNIFVKELESSGPFQKKIGHFVDARQLSDPDHPITISNWGTS